MIRRSLRFRLLAAAVVSVSLALVAGAFGLVQLFEHHVERQLNTQLETFLRELIGKVELDAQGTVRVRGALPDPRFEEPLSGLYWQVQDDANRLLVRSRSLWDAKLDLPQDRLTLGVVHRHELPGPGDQPLLVREQQVILLPQTQARRLRVAVALDRSDLLDSRAAFTKDILPYLGWLGLLLLGASWWQVRTGLSPLDRIRRGVLAVRGGTEQRLSNDYPEEVQPLVEEINALLSNRDAAVESARAWTADLAHGLKTPLTALSADAQRLRQKGEGEMAEALERLAETMRRRVDRELIRARLRAASTAGRKEEDLVGMVERVVATLQRTPYGEHISWHTDMPDSVFVAMQRDDLAELLGNLLDNAAKWARADVYILVQPGSKVRVRIEDDGPGVPEAALDVLGERGLRLDEQISGTGLGLAIAKDIVSAYGGDIRLSRSDRGGLAVELALPGRP